MFTRLQFYAEINIDRKLVCVYCLMVQYTFRVVIASVYMQLQPLHRKHIYLLPNAAFYCIQLKA